MPAAERDNNGRSAAAPAPRGHIWSRCSLPVKAGCAGNARCLGCSGTQPRSSRRHQPWARVLALQSWHGAGGRARGWDSSALQLPQTFLGKAPPNTHAGFQERPVPPVPPVPARSASLGVPAASPPLSHAVPPAGADPSPRGSHPGMCRDSRSGRGHTCTDQVSLPQGPPGCPLRECHSSRPDTQPLPA